MSAFNDQRLEEWRKQIPFEFNFDARGWDPDIFQAQLHNVCAYMMRELSRGHVPSFDLINKVFRGEHKPASCGYINCFIDFDHVH